MIGDGVIAESVISFKLTWTNPGKGEQPKWDQTDQEIIFHETSVYPDLLFTKAQAIATYYTYTNIDSLITLIKNIDAVIDSKINGSPVSEEVKQLTPGSAVQKVNPAEIQRVETPGTLQTVQKGQVPQTVQKSEPNAPNTKDEVDTIEQPTSDSDKPGDAGKYTVYVYGKSLRLLDAQRSSATIRIRHKISENLLRKVGDEQIDNSENIWLEVHTNSGKKIKLGFDDFTTAGDKTNLLVQVLPTIDMILTPSEKAVVAKSEKTVEDEDRLRTLTKIRRAREENRFLRSKEETDKTVRRARTIRT